LKEYVSKFEVAGDLSMLPGEAMADLGLRFARRTNSRGRNYFISNPTVKSVDGWVPLDGTVASAVLMDPMVEDHVGSAAVRHRDGKAEVYLQLGAGASTVLRTFEKEQVSGPAWEYVTGAGQPTDIEGTWHVTFVDGGPVLPRAFETNKLASWTRQEDPEAKRFAGTGKYTIDFDGPAQEADDYVLDLGKVAESARVRLNGQDLGTVWCAPYCVRLGKALKTSNHLEVEVTNLAANRIADLDRRGVQWKAFHEINFVNKAYKPFDASGWEPRDSGLIGPVKLVPLKAIQPGEEK
jgi:hypothetical protein